jgi:hypothetical protein
VRWLLQSRATPPLYTLTDPEHPIVEETRVALHEGEGNTALAPASFGTLAAARAVVLLALLVLLVERLLAWRLGARWR